MGVEETARVGRLKHHYADELSKALQNSARRQKRKLGDTEDSPSPPRPGPGPGQGSRSDGDSEDKGGGGWRGIRGRDGEERMMPSSREEGAGQQTRGGGEAIQLDVDPQSESSSFPALLPPISLRLQLCRCHVTPRPPDGPSPLVHARDVADAQVKALSINGASVSPYPPRPPLRPIPQIRLHSHPSPARRDRVKPQWARKTPSAHM